MQSKSSTSSILIVVLIIFTFPVWIGLIGGLFGIIAGVFGAVFGAFGAILGGIFGAFGALLGGFFGWIFDWDCPGYGDWNGLTIAIIILAVVLLSRSRKI